MSECITAHKEKPQDNLQELVRETQRECCDTSTSEDTLKEEEVRKSSRKKKIKGEVIYYE